MLGPDDLVLCSGTLLAASFDEKLAAAQAGGFRGITLWPHDYQRARESGASDAELRRRLADHGVVVSCVEPLLTWLAREDELALRSPTDVASESDLYRIADALGGSSLILAHSAGGTLDLDRAAAALAGVAERASRHGLQVTLEFLPWSGIPDAATAWEIVRRADHPGATVMVDTWHHFRGSCDHAQIRAIPGRKLGGIQLNDAPAAPADDLVAETMSARLLPGEGDIPLAEILRALRATGTRAPLGVEVFSVELDKLPPVEVGRRAGAAVRRVLALVALVLLALLPAASRAEHVWAELAAPAEGELVREPYGLVEIRGSAGTGLPGKHDVMIVIDLSESTWEASGTDVDGDRVTGRPSHARIPGESVELLTDPDDSIVAAQIGAARRFVSRLDPATTQIGIVAFAGSERTIAPLGADRAQLLGALDGLGRRPLAGGTYLSGGLMQAVETLEGAAAGSAERRRSIILLSDGLPNQPESPITAEKAALRAAQLAARAGIRIYAFALGPEVVRDPGVFRLLTETSGGELLLVEQPAEVLDYLPHLSLSRLDRVEVENLTAKSSARAVRLFPDGSFDAWAPLVPGSNRLRISVVAQSGARTSLEREVRFEQTNDERRRFLLIEALRERTLETQLAAEARLKRERALRRTLEISGER
jgi:sugar phosphate isomerase/epimerase